MRAALPAGRRSQSRNVNSCLSLEARRSAQVGAVKGIGALGASTGDGLKAVLNKETAGQWLIELTWR